MVEDKPIEDNMDGIYSLDVPSGCGAASPSQGPWDPDPLRPDYAVILLGMW